MSVTVSPLATEPPEKVSYVDPVVRILYLTRIQWLALLFQDSYNMIVLVV
jgi:hypothetical protein